MGAPSGASPDSAAGACRFRSYQDIVMFGGFAPLPGWPCRPFLPPCVAMQALPHPHFPPHSPSPTPLGRHIPQWHSFEGSGCFPDTI